jgi:hypothetical protein
MQREDDQGEGDGVFPRLAKTRGQVAWTLRASFRTSVHLRRGATKPGAARKRDRSGGLGATVRIFAAFLGSLLALGQALLELAFGGSE